MTVRAQALQARSVTGRSSSSGRLRVGAVISAVAVAALSGCSTPAPVPQPGGPPVVQSAPLLSAPVLARTVELARPGPAALSLAALGGAVEEQETASGGQPMALPGCPPAGPGSHGAPAPVALEQMAVTWSATHHQAKLLVAVYASRSVAELASRAGLDELIRCGTSKSRLVGGMHSVAATFAAQTPAGSVLLVHSGAAVYVLRVTGALPDMVLADLGAALGAHLVLASPAFDVVPAFPQSPSPQVVSGSHG